MRLQEEIVQIENKLILVDSLSNNLYKLESDKRGFQLTGDINYLKNIYTLKTSSRKIITTLKKDNIENRNRPLIFGADSLLEKRLSNLDSGIVIYTMQGVNASIAFMQLESNRNAREQLEESLMLIKIGLQKKREYDVATINSKSRYNITNLVILLVVSVLMMIVTANTIRRAQQRIIKNHFKFKEAQRIAKIGSWEWDIATNEIRWSHEQFNLFGEKRGEFELTMEGYLSHLSAEERENTMSLFNDALNGVKEFVIEHEIIRKDGTAIMVFEQGTVLYDENKKPVGMFGTTQDITAQKEIEEKLKSEKILLRTLIDNIPDTFYVKDAALRKMIANKADMLIMGVTSEEEYIGKTDMELFPGKEGGGEGYRNDLILLESGKPVLNMEEFFTDSNGKEHCLLTSKIPLLDSDGKISGLLGIGRDITEMKKTEYEMKVIKEKFQAIFDNTADGIYQSTTDGKFIMMNLSMAKIFGYNSPDEMIRSITNIGSQIYADPVERNKMSEQILAHGHVENYEVQVLTKTKDVIWVSANIRAVKNEEGAISFFEGTLEDITERKKAEQEILQLNRDLDQFANITAHDLQEPIRMVSGFLGLLEKKYSDVVDEQGKSYIYRAKDGADRMSILIKDLLEFSRSGNKAAKKSAVNLTEVLDLVNKDLSIVVADTNASLHVPDDLPVINGTHSALYRLFLNLISNGIKFRKKDIAPEIKLTVQEQYHCWEFSLSDNGIGVAQKDQSKLFQAFQRLHRRDEYPGTGLGLVTCKKIVETHGGKIWMTSEPGEGTTFHFTITKASEAA